MAKKNENQEVSEVQEVKVQEAPAVHKYRVYLACPIPLEKNPFEVEAKDDGEAWKLFCDKNGISDSIHEKTIVVVGE